MFTLRTFKKIVFSFIELSSSFQAQIIVRMLDLAYVSYVIRAHKIIDYVNEFSVKIAVDFRFEFSDIVKLNFRKIQINPN